MDIIKQLKKLDISAISDALDQCGVNGGCHLTARSKIRKIAGRAFTVKFKRVGSGVFAKAADYIEEVEEGNELVKYKVKCYVDEDDDGDYVILFEDTIFSAGFSESYQEASKIAEKWNKKVMRENI